MSDDFYWSKETPHPGEFLPAAYYWADEQPDGASASIHNMGSGQLGPQFHAEVYLSKGDRFMSEWFDDVDEAKAWCKGILKIGVEI